MGRPRAHDDVAAEYVTFRVSKREAAWIDHYARKAGKKRSGLVRQLVRDALIDLGTKREAV